MKKGNKKIKIAIKEVSKPLQIIETEYVFPSDFYKAHIPTSYPEYIKLNSDGTLTMGVDEDGRLKSLPCNFFMSINNPFHPIQSIVGTTVFVRTLPITSCAEAWDYEVTDLTDADIKFINTLLSETHQTKLIAALLDKGGRA